MDSKGRPILLEGTEPTAEGNRLCPGLAGAANWMAPSYNPQARLFYFPVRAQCDGYYTSQPVYVEGKPYWGSVFRGVTEGREWGRLKALGPINGATQWRFRYDKTTSA